MLKHLERSFEDDEVTGEKIKEQYPNQPQISDHLCRILIIGSSGSGKKNTLLDLISHQPDIDKMYTSTQKIHMTQNVIY